MFDSVVFVPSEAIDTLNILHLGKYVRLAVLQSCSAVSQDTQTSELWIRDEYNVTPHTTTDSECLSLKRSVCAETCDFSRH